MVVRGVLCVLKVILTIVDRRAPGQSRSRAFSPKALFGPCRDGTAGAAEARRGGASVEWVRIAAAECAWTSYRLRPMRWAWPDRTFWSTGIDFAHMPCSCRRDVSDAGSRGRAEAQGGGATSSGGQTGPVILRTYPYLTHGTAGPVTGGPPGRRWAASDLNHPGDD